MIGRSVGHYIIEEQLGQGGMGVVWGARDLRLHRRVALKSIRSDRDASPDATRRFLEEAQAVSALNHPSIVTIYDLITDDDGRDYIVMELVRGTPLRGPVGLRQAIRIGIDIARALAVPHQAGVVHRDLKPPNVMLTEAGSVKILDFGLARLHERARTAAAGWADITGPLSFESTETIGGAVAGTVSYMSPEQAEGRGGDARSDIFSLGCILYELVSGRRAFEAATPVATLAAVLRDTPKPVGGPFGAVVSRCLARDPAARYRSMDEVADALQRLIEPRRLSRWVWPVAAVALVAASLAAWRTRSAAPSQTWRVVPLTSFQGMEAEPALAPDGERVAFVWDGDVAGTRDIYIQKIGGGLERLTSTPELEYSPSWSPDGQRIAFVRPGKGVFTIAATGGAETLVRDLNAVPDSPPRWSPDGKWLVVALERSPDGLVALSVENGTLHELTAPPIGYPGDTRPLFSPDASKLWFVRRRNVWNHAVLELPLTSEMTAAGSPRELTDWSTAYRGIAMESQGTLLASGTVGARYMILRVPVAGGPPTPAPVEPISAINPTYSPGPRRLVYERTATDVNLWIAPGPTDGTELRDPVRLIASTYIDREGAWSRDGRHITFVSTRSGSYEVWIARADGSGQRQITNLGNTRLGTPRWSPDNRTLAFDAYTDGVSQIYTVDTQGGAPRRVTSEPTGATRPSWSQDGKWIWFASPEKTARVAAVGGPAEVFGPGATEVRESADGRHLFVHRSGKLYRDRDPEPWVGGVAEGMWTVVGQFVYVRERLAITRYNVESRDSEVVYRFGSGEPEPPRGSSMSVTADERSILFSRIDRSERDIMLVENFGK